MTGNEVYRSVNLLALDSDVCKRIEIANGLFSDGVDKVVKMDWEDLGAVQGCRSAAEWSGRQERTALGQERHCAAGAKLLLARGWPSSKVTSCCFTFINKPNIRH